VDKNADYARRVQSQTDEYIREILAQTQKLRTVASSLQAEKERLEEEVLRLRLELDRQRAEGDRLQRQLLDISRANQQSLDKYQAVAAQNASLANLYVATYQLHSTAEREQVLAAIQEVIANLIGCEELVIFETAGAGPLRVARAFGVDPAALGEILPGQGVIGRVAAGGEPFVALDGPRAPGGGAGPEPSACVPLKVDTRVIGVVALFRLLPQKGDGFNELDHELLNLLATQGATALFLTQLLAAETAS
jgi:hypothetical protein